MPLRRRPVARIATTAVVAGTAANMGARSAQRSAAAAQDEAAPPAPAPADEPAAPEAAESSEIEQLKAQSDAVRQQYVARFKEADAKGRGYVELSDLRKPQFSQLYTLFVSADRDGATHHSLERMGMFWAVFCFSCSFF